MPYFGILTAANPEGDLQFVKQEFQKLHEYFDPIADTINTIINYNATEQAVFETFLSKADLKKTRDQYQKDYNALKAAQSKVDSVKH